MLAFVQRHADRVMGVLQGFDRLRVRGTQRLLANAAGMQRYLWQVQVLLKNFKEYALSVTAQVRTAVEQAAQAAGRPIQYLYSTATSKEDVARHIAARDGIQEGLIVVLTCVEPCWSYDLRSNRGTRQLELRAAERRCLHYYTYWQHPVLGFMHARLQTWFPFTVHVCLNGREWLCRQLDAAGIGYQRRENCLVQVADEAAAQQLLDQQSRTDWPRLLNGLLPQVHPAHAWLSRALPLPYYWSVDESEWASDVLFKSPADLAALYPRLVRHGLLVHGTRDVLRFLGRKVPTQRGAYWGHFTGEAVIDLRTRPEGLRLKYRLNSNSVKLYDKQGSVLRVETTINDARDLKVFRPKEGAPNGPKSWRYLRKGVADLHRRALLSQAANERYLDALAAAGDPTPLSALADGLCRSKRWHGQRVRALNPLAPGDARLLEAVNRGEFTLHGFRNRDLRTLLCPPAATATDARRQSGAITRHLRLLRAPGLIRKLPHTHRYVVNAKGRRTIAALLTARAADVAKLLDAA